MFHNSAVESVFSEQIHLSRWRFWGRTLDLLTSKLMEYPVVWVDEDILSEPVTAQQEVMKHIMWFLQGKEGIYSWFPVWHAYWMKFQRLDKI